MASYVRERSPVDGVQCGVERLTNLGCKQDWAVGAALPHPVCLRGVNLVLLHMEMQFACFPAS